MYGLCLSVMIHAGIFLALIRLNEKCGWISIIDESCVEVTLVTQKGALPGENSGCQKPAAPVGAVQKAIVRKKTPVIKVEPVKASVEPVKSHPESKPKEPEVQHLPGESPPSQTAMTMLADIQPSAPEAAGAKNAGGEKDAGEGAGTQGINGHDLSAGKEGGGGAGAAGIDFRHNYLNMVRLKIEHQKKYPDVAQQRNLQGQVTVEFNIHLDGKISEPSVSKSSGIQSLDLAALDAVKKASPFDSPPRQIFNEAIHINLPIRFELIR